MSEQKPELNIVFDAEIAKWCIDGYIYGTHFFIAEETLEKASVLVVQIISELLYDNNQHDIDDEFRRIIGEE